MDDYGFAYEKLTDSGALSKDITGDVSPLTDIGVVLYYKRYDHY